MKNEQEIRVLMVEPSEYPKEVLLKNTLSAMQEAVGGRIDIVDLEGSTCLLLNDEGKLIGLDGNRRVGNDIIAGTFYVCGSNEEGELVSLSDDEMERYREMFWEPEEITQEEVQKSIRMDGYFLDF